MMENKGLFDSECLDSEVDWLAGVNRVRKQNRLVLEAETQGTGGDKSALAGVRIKGHCILENVDSIDIEKN
jgi:hypothetical protein